MNTLLHKAVQAWDRLRLRWLHGAEVGTRTDIGRAVVIRPRRGRIVIGSGCSLEQGAILDAYDGTIEIGPWVHVGPYTTIYGHGGVRIGEGSLIAMHCRILSSNHTVASQGTPIRSQPDIPLPTVIGRDVWLGAGVTVLGGVTIGDGCVVGAGAVVTRDLPAGSIAHGVPAVVKARRDGAGAAPS